MKILVPLSVLVDHITKFTGVFGWNVYICVVAYKLQSAQASYGNMIREFFEKFGINSKILKLANTYTYLIRMFSMISKLVFQSVKHHWSSIIQLLSIFLRGRFNKNFSIISTSFLYCERSSLVWEPVFLLLIKAFFP